MTADRTKNRNMHVGPPHSNFARFACEASQDFSKRDCRQASSWLGCVNDLSPSWYTSIPSHTWPVQQQRSPNRSWPAKAPGNSRFWHRVSERASFLSKQISMQNTKEGIPMHHVFNSTPACFFSLSLSLSLSAVPSGGSSKLGHEAANRPRTAHCAKLNHGGACFVCLRISGV